MLVAVSGIEAAIGLRVRAGSREALLRAAFDLIDTQPGLRVRTRSLVWSAADELVAVLAITAQIDIAGLERSIEQVRRRLSTPQGVAPLQLDLLWAPAGTVAPTGPPEYLATVPRSLLERPQPLTPGFAMERLPLVGGRVDVLVTRSRADLLAAAAEAFTLAPRAAEPIGAATLLPNPAADTRIELALPREATLGDRLERWLRAVEQVVMDRQLAVRRVVVLDDAALSIHGVLFGDRRTGAPTLGQLRDVVAREDPSTGEHRAEISVLDRPSGIAAP